MVATHNQDWAAKIKTAALHGLSQDAWARFSDKGYKHYQVVSPGFKYNMTDIQASFGLHQLRRLESNLRLREEIWEEYDAAFEGLPIILPPRPASHVRHARHLYAIQIPEAAGLSRDDFMQAMHERRVGTGVHYMALPLHRYYQETYQLDARDFSTSIKYGLRTVSLPLSPKLKPADVNDVIEAVKTSLRSGE
jgi:dTDP-4-amino-4,6-dideoxygalactose transaminase